MLNRLTLCLLTCTAAAWLLTGCGTTDHGTLKDPDNERSETRLRVGDQLTIRLDTGGKDMPQVIETVIDQSGDISLPLIGRIKAAGFTSGELGERIQTSYVPRYFVHCNAAIVPTIRFFYVGGEVRLPARYNWTEDVTLMKAVNAAGGFTDYANRRKVELVRGKNKQTFDCEDLRQHPDKDVPVQPGDSIYVARSIF